MLVCICTGHTESDIRAAIADGARTLEQISEVLDGTGTVCESCQDLVLELLAEEDPAKPNPEASATSH